MWAGPAKPQAFAQFLAYFGRDKFQLFFNSF